MNKRHRSELKGIIQDGIIFDCPMDRYTTFRVGGKAEAICFVSKLSLLKQVVSFLTDSEIPYLIIGNGSNLLVRDAGIKGVVIILKEDLAIIEQDVRDDETLIAGGGLSILKLLNFCARKGLTGMEFLAGIPGTIGGAVFMNAGAFDMEIGSMVRKIHTVDKHGDLETVDQSQIAFSYRESSISEDSIIYRVVFKLKKETEQFVKERIADYFDKRKKSQPLDLPSGGSVFKNPSCDYAGRLIEKAGLKGVKVGDAMVSEKHANFIVNLGNAKATDILDLIEYVKERVLKETGVELATEIKVVGG